MPKIIRYSLVMLALASAPAGLAQSTNDATAAPPAAARKPYGWNMTIDKIPKDLKVEDNIVYKTASGQDLKLIAFYPKVKKFAKAPLLVYIHGGGWGAGNRFVVITSGGIEMVEALSEAGIFCISIEYRLMPQGTQLGISSMDQEADCRDAIHFMVKNAARFGIDPQRIATTGGSAGGHLSLVTALGKDADYPCDPALAKYSNYKILAEVADFPLVSVVNPELLKTGTFSHGSHIDRLIGGPLAEHQDAANKLSPLVLLKPDSPAIMLVHGAEDHVLDVKNSIAMAALCKQKGVPCELIVVKGADHGFRQASPSVPIDPSQAEISQREADFVLKYLLPGAK
jgi:acetyl esterase/lipase